MHPHDWFTWDLDTDREHTARTSHAPLHVVGWTWVDSSDVLSWLILLVAIILFHDPLWAVLVFWLPFLH